MKETVLGTESAMPEDTSMYLGYFRRENTRKKGNGGPDDKSRMKHS
jgi:hypothetical protein